MLKDRDYDVTPYIILILSLTCTPNGQRVGEECEVARGWGLGETSIVVSHERYNGDIWW